MREPCPPGADLTLLGSQGVIPLGGCVVTASENAGMPFAIVVNLEDFTVRTRLSFSRSSDAPHPYC